MNSWSLLPILFEAAIRTLLAALTVAAGLRLLRVRNVLILKAVWSLVLLASLAMPLLMRWQPLPESAAFQLPALRTAWASQNISTNPSPARSSAAPAADMPTEMSLTRPTTVSAATLASDNSPAASSVSSASTETNAQAHLDVPSMPVSVTAAPKSSAPVAAPIRLLPLAGVLYLAVAAILLLRLLIGLATAVRLWQSAHPIPFTSGPSPAVGIRSSARVSSPVNIGSGIILPTSYASWEPEKIRIVLAHEQAHIRQRDFYLQLLAGLHAAVFWFSPLAWWLQRKLSELSEAISDRAGLEHAASRTSYAQLLLEFAALPRPTQLGVAMARTSNLSLRIERLLNDANFRQAFMGARRRALLAVLLVPVALFAATSLIRVHAAAYPQAALSSPVAVQASESAPAAAPSDRIGQSTPDPAPVTVEVPAAQPQPAPAPVYQAAPVPPLPPMAEAPGAAPAAPMPPVAQDETTAPLPPLPPAPPRNHGRGYSYSYSNNGEAYGLVGDDVRFNLNGDWDGARNFDLEKARKMANGAHFLWFRHDGKTYIVDDPAFISQIEAFDKSMRDLGEQMRAIGMQQRELGKQQRELGAKLREVKSIPAPDLSKEMAEVNAAVAELTAKKGATISAEQLRDLQREIGKLQSRIGEMEGKIYSEQFKQFSSQMGELGQQQGKFGGEEGKLGAQMGRLARDREDKIRSTIDESLKNGKAKPVE